MSLTPTPSMIARLSALVFMPWAVPTASAQTFNGGGVTAGLNEAAGVTGVDRDDVYAAMVNVLKAILSYTALLATAMIILAGFYLVLSLGDDEKKDKAKKIIYYTLIGLVVILFARVIVSLITEWLPTQV